MIGTALAGSQHGEYSGSYRFKVDDRVECWMTAPGKNRGNCEWLVGTVVALHYVNDEGINPYQVCLDNGNLIFVPFDSDTLIRPAPVLYVDEVPSNSGEAGLSNGNLLQHEHED